ncbi:TPA: hypothetical protein H1008_02550 [archaeon]|nr:hypothetical protein [Candidatus Undinarchaeales archaeon SRR5007147.bin71]
MALKDIFSLIVLVVVLIFSIYGALSMSGWLWLVTIGVLLYILKKYGLPILLKSIPWVGTAYCGWRAFKEFQEADKTEAMKELALAAGALFLPGMGLVSIIIKKSDDEKEGSESIGDAITEFADASREQAETEREIAREQERIHLIEEQREALEADEAGTAVPPSSAVEGEEGAVPREKPSTWSRFSKWRKKRKLDKAEAEIIDPDKALVPTEAHYMFVVGLSVVLQAFYFRAGLFSNAWLGTALLILIVTALILLVDRKLYGWYGALDLSYGQKTALVAGLAVIVMLISISLNPLIAADFDATMDQIKAVPGHIGDGIVDSWYYVKAKILPPTVAGVAIRGPMDFEACYPFCVTEGGSKKEIWQGFEITTLKMIPSSVYDYQPFSVVTEFQNKGVGDTTFELPLSSLGAQTVIEFQGEVINCDIFALVRKTIQDVAGELSGEDYYNTNLCLWSSPLAQKGNGNVTPVVTGACRSQIFDDDGYPIALDDGKEVSVSYSETTDAEASYNDSENLLTLPVGHHLGFDFSGEARVIEDESGDPNSTHSIPSSYGLIQKTECTLKPQDITQIRWYGMKIGGANLGVGDVQQPDIMLTVNYTFLPKTDLVGTLVIQDVQTQVTATSAEQKIVNKISKSYSPAGPLMMAFGTAEEQIIAEVPTLFLVQLRNKGSGIVQKIEQDKMVIYIPTDFTIARSGTAFCDFVKNDSNDLDSYFREGFENNNDGTLTDPTSGTIYRTYTPGTKAARSSLTDIESGSNVLKNPPFGCLLRAPKLAEGREFETYDFRVRLKEYIYQEAGVEKITIYGTCADACGTATACSCDTFYEEGMDTINDYFNTMTGEWTNGTG